MYYTGNMNHFYTEWFEDLKSKELSDIENSKHIRKTFIFRT